MKDYKHVAKSWELIIVVLLIIAYNTIIESNNTKRHQEVMHFQDSIATHIHFMDSIHYSNCSFKANENYKPFGN